MLQDTLTKGGVLISTNLLAPEVVQTVAKAVQTPEQISGVMQLITSIIVSVVTLVQLFKKPKKSK